MRDRRPRAAQTAYGGTLCNVLETSAYRARQGMAGASGSAIFSVSFTRSATRPVIRRERHGLLKARWSGAHDHVPSAANITTWFQQAILHFYPNSTYAQWFDPDLIERARTMIFTRPQVGARVICPYCGAYNSARAGMMELIAFVRLRCGEGVTVTPPKVQ